MIVRFVLLILAFVLVSCASNTSPLSRETRPEDHGNVGAGEGPALKGGMIYFTDGKGINQFNLITKKASVFRTNCGSPNGLMFDREGRMIRCESKGRRVTREEADGSVTVLADRFNGRRFNSPNDLTLRGISDIYFTDPRYGPRVNMEIKDDKGRLVEGVYRINLLLADIVPPESPVELILGPDDVERPNGILITPDGKHLYVADNNNNTHGGSRKLLRFTLDEQGNVKAGSRKVIFDWKNGRGPDGVKMDHEGRLFAAAGRNESTEYETNEFKAGCYILSPKGRLLGFVPTAPDEATNCVLGHPSFGCAYGAMTPQPLYITSGGHLWSVSLK